MCELESFLNSCQAVFFFPFSSPFPCTEIAVQALGAHGKTQSDGWPGPLPLLPQPRWFLLPRTGLPCPEKGRTSPFLAWNQAATIPFAT